MQPNNSAQKAGCDSIHAFRADRDDEMNTSCECLNYQGDHIRS
ncbi:MAG: hypothetical protein ACE1ZG_05460 [Gammaproteobacteria bacterium]